MSADSTRRLPTGICIIEGCNKPANRKGWCWAHYQRSRAHGCPNTGRVLEGAALSWLKEHAHYEGDNCLVWPFYMAEQQKTMAYLGRKISVARLMCTLAHGEPASSDLEAAHSCGMGHLGCLNPKHLRWASQMENAADKIAHGTSGRGDKNSQAKLLPDQVVTIRSLGATHTKTQIAAMFGVTRTRIGQILRGQGWGHLS